MENGWYDTYSWDDQKKSSKYVHELNSKFDGAFVFRY